jgi:hypothetical protein
LICTVACVPSHAIRGSGRLPDCLPTEERRTYSVSTGSAVEFTDPVSQARNSVPDGTGRVCVLPYRPSQDWSSPGAYSSSVCHLVPTTDQASGSQHRPQPKEVFGTLPQGRRCYRPVRCRNSLLRHQADGQVEIRRSPAVLST